MRLLVENIKHEIVIKNSVTKKETYTSMGHMEASNKLTYIYSVKYCSISGNIG